MQTNLCDRCGSPGAHRIEISLALWSVVNVDRPTGHVCDCYACEACQAEVADLLFQHAKSELSHAVPAHRSIESHASLRDEAQSRFNEMKPVLQAYADAGTKLPDKIAAERDAVVAEIAKHEANRISVVRQETSEADIRTKALFKRLKK